MGAVQKLATVVIIGLVAMATVLVVYLADEPNRRGGETTEQEDIALERGTNLYITYCLQCHGPSGYGAAGNDDPRRVGARLNQDPAQVAAQDNGILFHSVDPAMQARAEAYIRYSVIYGKPADPRLSEKVMPAFGQDLNVEQLNDIVYLLMYGDWDYIYNQVVLNTGKTQAQADCDAQPDGTPTASFLEDQKKACELAESGDYALYPTVPPKADATEASDAATSAPADGSSVLLEAQDPFNWSQDQITVKPGDTIQVVNTGVSEHDFSVDAWGINEMLTSDPITVTIPADAKPGDYEFYCSIPGHKENGMVGTITVEG